VVENPTPTVEPIKLEFSPFDYRAEMIGGNVNGIIQLHKLHNQYWNYSSDKGAIIGEIKVLNPDETNTSLKAGDFKLDESMEKYFEIKEVNGHFLLKLQDSYHLQMHDGLPKLFQTGDYPIKQPAIPKFDEEWNLTVSLDNDTATPNVLEVTVATAHVIENNRWNHYNEFVLSKNHGKNATVLGSEGKDEITVTAGRSFKLIHSGDSDDTIRISSNSFELGDRVIHGGDGHDKLILGSWNHKSNNKVFDFTQSNGENLKSIENIVLSNHNSTLKINIEDVLNLLKTSENGQLKITGNGNKHQNSKVEFMHGDEKTTLKNYDGDGGNFDQKMKFQGNKGYIETIAERNYYVFEHDLGQVLVDVNLIG